MHSRRALFVRLAWYAAIIGALAFAVQGGEYSTYDLVRQRRERVRMVRAIDSVTHVVDSLRRYRDRLKNDPKLQERIAREEFGMVRGQKELLYRLVEPRDSTSTGRRR